ncbi:unnamed protein product [Spodoptera littoralis]|uniref:Cathepsin propeptide inhibitor domain-containing protein n=1 Tax=Spodoptera littoralis TaxID=7109 RepID=A0A9P0NA78_SPOLI|nr:unnamed protein product [Spodoptera littoralis]CAH1645457.1 unnamed protein product [Spodoptera littoralis]
MRSINIVLILAVVAIVNAAPADKDKVNDKPYYDIKKSAELFEKYIKDYNKHYKDEADKKVHYLAFVESLKIINKYNAESDSAVFDINYLADYTKEEMEKMHGLRIPTTTPSVVY